MQRPQVSLPEIDFGASFSFLFRLEGGWRSIFLGGLLFLLFPLLLIPPIVAFGWAIATGRAVARGEESILPFEFGHFWDGLRLSLVVSVYYLPVLFLLLPTSLATLANPESAGLRGLFFLPSMVGQLYALAVSAILPAVYAVYIAEGTFGACFSPRLLGQVIRPRGWIYAGVAAISYGAQALSAFGFFLCLIGVFFTLFYAIVVTMHLSGQLARGLVTPKDAGLTPPPPATTFP